MSFCQVCRHELPGHEPDCPVFTQKPVPGTPGPFPDHPEITWQMVSRAQQQGEQNSLGQYGMPSTQPETWVRYYIKQEQLKVLAEFSNSIELDETIEEFDILIEQIRKQEIK